MADTEADRGVDMETVLLSATEEPVDAYAPIRQQMQEISTIANGLYNNAKRDCPGVPEPMGWILNQAAMRASWERFHAITDRKREPFRSIMLRNPYSKYMRFMYESYPPGFGDEILQSYREDRPFDGAVVYYHLTRGTD